mgnify:CR=1 FL=1
MAGELNGTQVLIKKGTSTIVGQMEATLTFNGTPIDISNKSHQDWVTLLSGELAGKQLQVAGSIIYTNENAYREMREDAMYGRKANYKVEFADGEEFTASFVPTGLADNFPRGQAQTSSFTLVSSGSVSRITVE